MSNLRSVGLRVLFLVFVTAWSLFLTKKAELNWDLIPYMGVVAEYSRMSPKQLHSHVFENLRNSVSKEVFEELTTSNNFRARCFNNYEFFYEQLTYYRLKPLYTLAVYATHGMGFNLVESTYIPSLLAFWLLSVFIFFWLTKNSTSLLHYGVAFLVPLLSPVIEVGTMSTPDALSTLILLLAYWHILYGRYKILTYALLLLAVFVRVDNLIFVVIYSVFFNIKRDETLGFIDTLKKGWLKKLGVVSSLVAAFFLLPVLFGNGLYWFEAFEHLFSPAVYIDVVKRSAVNFSVHSSFPLFLCLFFLVRKSLNLQEKQLIYLILIAMLIRLVIFPLFQERFFVSFELLVLVVGALGVRREGF